ncbi:MAG: hypothetical protein DRO40_11240 [Thermoprotei archaeon]|nr:MAG: hypothetical protein DRO40_11240 [Thermoprotei archaeon]
MKRILRGEPVDDLVNKYILCIVDSHYYEVLRHNIPSYKLDLYDLLNWVMELQDTLSVLRGEEIDINSIYAYLITMVIP